VIANTGTIQTYITKDLSIEYTLRPIENQGQCGSCASFATAHTINDNILTMAKGCTNTPVSEQYVLDCLHLSNPSITNYCATGASMQDLWTFWKNYGSTSTSCLPYHATQLACPNTCDGGTPFPFTAKTTSQCVYGVAAMQAALDAGHTLAIGLMLYAQFQTDFASNSFACNNLYPSATGSTTVIGGHAMEVVGYGTYNGQTFWKIKNSWGTGWGCNGYVYMATGQLGLGGGTFENFGACYATPGTCIASSPFATSSLEYDGLPSPFESHIKKTSTLSVSTVDGTTGAPPQVVGGINPASLSDPLVQECATFAAEVVMALPKAQGGLECISNVNNSFHPTGTDDEASLINLQIMSGDQQIVGGQLIHVLFDFTTSDKRCPGAGGSYDATVHVDPTGRLILQDVHKTTTVLSSPSTNKTLILETTVPAGFFLMLVVAVLAIRWYKTRSQYVKLQSTHKELVRRVTVMEKDSDAPTKARLSQILGQMEHWQEYQQPLAKEASDTAEPQKDHPAPPAAGARRRSIVGNV
jgi:hypothetical protein